MEQSDKSKKKRKGAQGKTVSLILGSGGARGYAHIGVIRWLEDNGFVIESISGSSIGAAIGGVYAAGKLDEFTEWVCSISKVDIITLLDLSWQRSGFVKGDKIIATLVDLVGEQRIEDLPIKFTAVASDIENEKEIWLNSGKLFDAIRASISLPLFFTPVRRKGIDLIDGGVLNPVPIAPTFGDDTDMKIAVNLGGAIEAGVSPPQLAKKSNRNWPLHPKIASFIDKIKASISNGGERDWSAYDVANQAFDAMQGTIARQKLAAYPADHTVEIVRNACGMMEFNRAEEMIELGYRQADKSLSFLVREDAEQAPSSIMADSEAKPETESNAETEKNKPEESVKPVQLPAEQ